MTAVITAVPRDHVGNVWHLVSPWLDKSIARTHGRWHNVDVLTSLIDGTASLWLAFTQGDKPEIIGSLVLTISYYPSGMKIGRIEHIAGHDRDEWFEPMWDAIVVYCRDEGCDLLETMARRGTAEYLKQWGSKQVGYFYEYDLKKKDN